MTAKMSDPSSARPREIIATIRTEERATSGWRIVERIVKSLAAIAVPILLAVLARAVQLQTVDITTRQQLQLAELTGKQQTQLADATAKQQAQLADASGRQQAQLAEAAGRQEYVKLAVSILKEPLSPEQIGQEQPLRAWAVSLLEKHTPVELTPKAKLGLESGALILPRAGEYYYPRTDGEVEVDMSTPKLGDEVTFSANGLGGNGYFTYEWIYEDAVVSHNRVLRTRFHNLGKHTLTVRITSNNDTVFRDAEVRVIK